MLEVRAEGLDVFVGPERHGFATAREAEARARLLNEALSWVGTPFRDCADVKGRAGAVDCAMLMVRCVVDAGLAEAFDPRPYAPRWHVHRSEELFIGFVERLGGREVAAARVGDLILWRFGRCFSHGGIKVSDAEVMHAYGAAGFALVSRLDEPLLTHIGGGGYAPGTPRPVKLFDLLSGRADARPLKLASRLSDSGASPEGGRG